MSALAFAVSGARVEPYAAVPTIVFRLRIAETTGTDVHVVALRAQIQIEPRRRRYAHTEQDRLLDMFGEPARWGETLRTLVWTHAGLMVPGFAGEIEVDLPVVCTYDFDVAAAKFFHALDDGEIPLVFLFNGTVFSRAADGGFEVEPVPWDREAAYRLPVQVWRDLMDRYFPGTTWIRLRRDSIDALHRFKSERALPTWDAAVEALLAQAAVREPL